MKSALLIFVMMVVACGKKPPVIIEILEPVPPVTIPERRAAEPERIPEPQTAYADYDAGPAIPHIPHILFEFDCDDIRPQEYYNLHIARRYLEENPGAIAIIHGHTCSIGTHEYNIALGARRAHVVKMFLSSSTVHTDRLKTLSYGKTRPVSDDLILNRRVEIIIQ